MTSLSSLFGKSEPSATVPEAPTTDKARYQGTLIARGLTKTYRTRRVVNGVSLVVTPFSTSVRTFPLHRGSAA